MDQEILNIEKIFDRIGGFGRFQFFALVSIIYSEMPAGILGMLPVFVGSIPTAWNCTRGINGTNVTDTISTSNLCSCQGLLSGGDESIVSEWNLVCDYSWVSDFITSVQMGGMFIGGFFGSQVADWIGRKNTLYMSCLLMVIAGAVSSVSPSPFAYAAARFIVGVNIAAYLVVGAIYPMEFFTPKYRSLSGTLGPWGEGVMLLSFLAYIFPSWRTLSWVTCLPMTLVFLSFPFMPESPRWLLRHGKVTEAKNVFRQIAKWNGCENVEDEEIEALAKVIGNGKLESNSFEQGGLFGLLKNRKFCSKILIFMGIWFSYSLIYYGASFGVKNLSGDIHLNMFYMGLIDSVAFPTSVLILTWLGRRMATILFAILAAVPLVGIILMELDVVIPKSSLLTVVFNLGSRFFVDGGWATVKCFTGESFPTSMRSSALGISTVAAAIGGIIAPQIVFLGTIYPTIPYFVFGGFAILSACLSFLLVETRGKPIEENDI